MYTGEELIEMFDGSVDYRSKIKKHYDLDGIEDEDLRQLLKDDKSGITLVFEALENGDKATALMFFERLETSPADFAARLLLGEL